MKKFIMGLPLAALAAVTFGGAAHASTWKYYGVDPAYKTKPAAKADAANVMRRGGWSPEVIAAMQEKMKADPERIELRTGDYLDFMRSGATALWHDVNIAFVPPGGKGVDVVVKADRWTVTVNGTTYEVIIPDVCNNVALRVSKGPLCDLIVFTTTKVGEVRTHDPMYNPDYDATCSGTSDVVFENGNYRLVGARKPIKPGCIDKMKGCSYVAADRYVGSRYDVDGSIEDLKPGLHAVLVTRKASTSKITKFGICLERVDPKTGKRIRTSYTVVIGDEDFDTMPNGQRVAVAHYKRSQVKAASKPGTWAPKSQYFWEDEVAIASE